MLFEARVIQGVTVVTLRVAQITGLNCFAVKESIGAAVKFGEPTIMDLSLIDDLDSSGLSLIVHWLAEGRRMGGAVLICSGSPRFHALVELVRIPSFTTVYSSLRDALRACGRTAHTTENADQAARTPRVGRVRTATA
jgi:anti-anti-sigma regulatory factor